MARFGLQRRAERPGAPGARQRDERTGVAAIEFAILLPVFLLLVFGLIETALMEWTNAALQHAAEMAARCASVNQATCSNTACCGAGNIEAYALTQAYGMALPAATFAYTTPACGHQVATAPPGYPFTFRVPMYGSVQVDLNAQSCMP